MDFVNKFHSLNQYHHILYSTVEGYKLGKVIIEGKTKQVYDLPEQPGLCLLLSKDRITAGDGVKAHDLAGKAEISNTTNGQVVRLLNEAGELLNHISQMNYNALQSISNQIDQLFN